MKSMFPSTLAIAAGTLLISSASLHASDTDSRIESSATKSYVFKTYLANDSITVDSKDGVVTLTGELLVLYRLTLWLLTLPPVPSRSSCEGVATREAEPLLPRSVVPGISCAALTAA